MRVPVFPILLLAALVGAASTHAAPLENPYDVLGKTLRPFVNLVAKKARGPERALKLKATIEGGTDLPPGIAGLHAEVALEAPDRLRVRAPFAGEEITVCRDGDKLWATPGAKLESILAAAAAIRKLPPLDKKFQLEPLQLPFPEKQLIFLPALFTVKDEGAEAINGEPCRVLDLQLMPELGRSKSGSFDWTARLWVRRDHRPARLRVQRPGWEITVRFDEVLFTPTLPAETWHSAPAQSTDLLTLTPPRFDQILRSLIGAK